MEKVFSPVTDLIGSLYDLLFDAATKVWSLAKPVVMIGLLFDLITGHLGWISQILGHYRDFMLFTSQASTLVLIVVAVVTLAFVAKR